MGSDNFCLKWNDFEANISVSFKDIRRKSEFFDVTLACDGGDEQIQAHKLVLASCSPFFRKVLNNVQNSKNANGQNPLIYLKGIDYPNLSAVLNFMYYGEVNVAQEELSSFLKVAEELSVKGLTDGKKNDNPPGGQNRPPPPVMEDPKKSLLKKTLQSPLPGNLQPLLPLPPLRSTPKLPSLTQAPVSKKRKLAEPTKHNILPQMPTMTLPNAPNFDLSGTSPLGGPNMEAIAALNAIRENSLKNAQRFQAEQKKLQIAEAKQQQDSIVAENEDEIEDDEPPFDPSEMLEQNTNEMSNRPSSNNSGEAGQLSIQDSSHDDSQISVIPDNSFNFDNVDKSALTTVNDYVMRNPAGTYYCKGCGHHSSSRRDLQRHIEARHISGDYQCKYCDKVMTTKYNLQRHQNKNHKEQVMQAKMLEADGGEAAPQLPPAAVLSMANIVAANANE